MHYGLYAVWVGGEVCTRSLMCYGGGEVWVHGDSAILYMSRLDKYIRSSIVNLRKQRGWQTL